jgi:hypothetical protein
MKVFCPEHHKGFFTPRQSPIRCESRGHVLGDLDFQGTAKVPAQIRWQYCCNCEHFCPIDFERDRLERCPVCTRRISTLYICDRCYTVGFESNTPLQTKNFTLTAEGAPNPSCPGCLEESSTDLHEHDCGALEVTFITGLNICPICEERLDVGPVFPSSVSQYLRRTKSANKINVTFDYDTEQFVPVADGEFVLVNPNTLDGPPIVLPRSTSFASRRDFYELYQDYYHCQNVTAGEVTIVEPAIVRASGGGWKLESSGILEVEPQQSAARKPVKKQKPQITHQLEVVEQQPSSASKNEEPVERTCPNCGSEVEAKYAFCWRCGNKMGSGDGPTSKEAKEPQPPLQRRVVQNNESSERNIGDIRQGILASVPSWRRFAAEDDEETVQHDKARVRPPTSSRNLLKETTPIPASHSILKLIGIAVIGVLVASLGLSVLTRATSQPLVSSESQSTPAAAVSIEPTATVAKSEPEKEVISKSTPQDDELRKLQTRRVNAIDSDRSKILQAFAKTEKRFPDDYRFPYERAKFVVKTKNKAARQDAFNALATAADRAIKNDKADEMLEGLEADRRGDFQQLAHNRREWSQVVEALKSKDSGLLAVNAR